MERADGANWLQRYVAAWRSYDPDEIAALFAPNARYRYHPYDTEWVEGPEEIIAAWLDDRDEPGSWDAAYEPAAIDGEVVFATGSTTYSEPDGSISKIYDNVFQMRFDDEGRCTEFTEWFMERPS
jgi:hypothetical protein